MDNQYIIERKEIKKRLLCFLVGLAIFIAVIGGIGVKNSKKDAEGPKDLLTLDIAKSRGEFVKLSFDKMGLHFAEYVSENTREKNKVETKRVYFYQIDDKLMAVQISNAIFHQFDELVILSDNGKVPVDNPIEKNGRMQPIDPQVKKIAKEELALELDVKKVSEEEFDMYIWPVMMDLAIPKEIGEDFTKITIILAIGAYLFFALIMILATSLKLSILKRKYVKKQGNL